VSALRFEVPVAAPPAEVRARLVEAGDRPGDLVNWFTDDPKVDAAVTPAGDGWRVRVVGSAFTAEARVTVSSRAPGSVITVDGALRGRGLFAVATPVLRLATPRVEAEARRTLQREFGVPASSAG
jgi:hypothetical protein